ncbi:MAG: hypothetical protein K2K90_00735 [Lachnospiraceae bacterium]|nr:hypothetical protein [Lachnospiraceae bacterium]
MFCVGDLGYREKKAEDESDAEERDEATEEMGEGCCLVDGGNTCRVFGGMRRCFRGRKRRDCL